MGVIVVIVRVGVMIIVIVIMIVIVIVGCGRSAASRLIGLAMRKLEIVVRMIVWR